MKRLDFRTRRGQYLTAFYRGLGYQAARVLVRVVRALALVGLMWLAWKYWGEGFLHEHHGVRWAAAIGEILRGR
jgi:hypothetical protein